MGFDRGAQGEGVFMNDLIFIGIVTVFFVLGGLYARGCDQL